MIMERLLLHIRNLSMGFLIYLQLKWLTATIPKYVKLSTMKSSVPAEKVEANYDLLMSILVRLPPKSLFRFRCVSNRWNNIIVNPYFLRSYSAIARKHGSLRGQSLLASVQLTGLNVSLISDLERCDMVPRKLGDFINCSNGLVLCGKHYSSNTYHVWNPLTKKLVSLPPPILLNRTNKTIAVAFVCEENTNELRPNYMVVRAGIERLGEWVIETYSSRTGMWTVKPTLNTDPIFVLSVQPTPLVCNGVVHWSGMKSIALYNLNGGENENENHHVQFICLPLPDIDHWSLTRSERDDVLWLGYTEEIDTNMRFWMLPKKINDGRTYRRSTAVLDDEWIFMHTITSASLHKEPALKLLENNNKRIYDPRSEQIRLEGFTPCNPIVVVIRRGKRVFLYNIESKSIKSLDQYDHEGTKWWYPYMDSLYLSSYAL